jgi:hypothetical protein
MSNEYDVRLRALMAERLRPVPPAPTPTPSALSRYQALIDLAAEAGDDLTVEAMFTTADQGGEGR